MEGLRFPRAVGFGHRFGAPIIGGQLIMGLWTHPMEEAKLRDRLRCGTGNDVVISLADAMSRVRQKGQARLNPRGGAVGKV